jgi:Tol biopolymer transport system component
MTLAEIARATRSSVGPLLSLSLGLVLSIAACAGGDDANGSGAAVVVTQAPPGTDIWLATLTQGANGALGIQDALNVTQRPGYDNQPYFLPDGSAFLYTVIDEAGQADIWRYDLAAGTARQVTHTAPESEYSPTPMRGGGFSVVRVEADSAQRLWRFDADGTNPTLLIEGIQPVGYHAWSDTATAVLYVLGDPPTLEVARPGAGAGTPAARDVGRSLQRIPGGNDVSYVQRLADGGTEIRRLHPSTGTWEPLIAGLQGGDFHAWTPDGTLLQAHEGRVYAWRPGTADWSQIADLSPLGIAITRIAVSPDGSRIALVGETGA